MQNQPEKLNLWDRLFNRYKTMVIDQGEDKWTCRPYSINTEGYNYFRDYVLYSKFDRLTGAEVKRWKKYLN